MQKVKKTCDWCGKEYELLPCEVRKKLKNKHSFCSKKCALLFNNKITLSKYPLSIIEVECSVCGKLIQRQTKKVVKQKTFICSAQCRKEFAKRLFSKDKIKVNCDYCGKEIKRVPSLIHLTNFCSKDCQNKFHSNRILKENNPNWFGGKSFEPYGFAFNKSIKKVVLDRDNQRCAVCNQKNKTLCVHHIDYDKNNNLLDNLISVCRSCHSKTNFNRNEWVYYFRGLMK